MDLNRGGKKQIKKSSEEGKKTTLCGWEKMERGVLLKSWGVVPGRGGSGGKRGVGEKKVHHGKNMKGKKKSLV